MNNKTQNIIDELVVFFICRGNQDKLFQSRSMNYNWGIIWQTLSPLIIVLGWTLFVSLGIRGKGFDLEYFVFLLLFIFSFNIICTAIINLGMPDELEHKKNINIHILAYSLFISNFIPLVIRFALVSITLIFFNYHLAYFHLFYGLLITALLALFYGIAINAFFNGSNFLKDSHVYVLTLVFITSSVILPVTRLPEAIRNIFLYNPLAHVSEWIKTPITGVSYEYIDITYPLKLLFILAILSPIFLWHINKNKYKDTNLNTTSGMF
jgi:ABC-type polysaccharide/polyol phosphate export permease